MAPLTTSDCFGRDDRPATGLDGSCIAPRIAGGHVARCPNRSVTFSCWVVDAESSSMGVDLHLR